MPFLKTVDLRSLHRRIYESDSNEKSKMSVKGTTVSPCLLWSSEYLQLEVLLTTNVHPQIISCEQNIPSKPKQSLQCLQDYLRFGKVIH